MLQRRLNSLLIVALAATASVAACGSDLGDSPGSDGDAGMLDETGAGGDSSVSGDGSVLPGSDGSTTDGSGTDASKDATADGDADFDAAVPDGPDDPPVAFPTTVPRLFGYTLQDAFPGTFLSGAMDIDWPVGSTQPYVLQRGGHIVRLHSADSGRDLVLDFSAGVAFHGEAGALGMALHPKFADAADPHPYVYVWFNAQIGTGHQQLVRWTLDPMTKSFDPASKLVLVDQVEQADEHNGAHIHFGPDGFLYFGNGDDTRTDVTTQTLTGGLFSGVFRIDVDMNAATSHAPPKQPLDCVTQGYYIPNTNPFVGVANAAEEYFALGFRNPYAFSFDKLTGKIWLTNVGDTWREEIDNVVAGGNYGWPFYEGSKQRRMGAPAGLKPPTYDYTHASMGDLSAVIGGFVYRGAAMPELAGKFIYSDWPTGRVWAMDTATGVRSSLFEWNNKNSPVGFGQDAAGEVYLIAWDHILKIVHAPPHAVPKKLSETKIFRNLGTLKVPTAVVPYQIKSPLWSDGAAKLRWVYVPAGQTATMTASGTVTFPVGSMLIKQFDLPATAQPLGGRSKRLETRIMVVGSDDTYGVTYRWNALGTDADLVLEPAEEAIGDAVPAEARTWHYPSSGECWSCHRAENRILAFRGEQMNFTVAGGAMNQLADLAAKNVFDAASIASSPAPIASPSDPAETIDARASAYLAANCSSCHHPGASYLGGGNTWNALPGVPSGMRGLVNQPHHNLPMATALGLPNAPLVAPGNPAGSILYGRINATDQDVRMQPLLRTKIDPVGVQVISDWITAGPP